MSLQKNHSYQLSIQSLSTKGLGKGTIDGFPVLVAGTLPGEKIEVLITKVMSTRAYGKCLSILELSKERVSPPCSVFGPCGGCQLQHLSPSAQKGFKLGVLQSFLDEAALSYPKISYLDSPDAYHYRNKLQFAVSKSLDGLYHIGLFASRSQRVVDCQSCEIQDPLNNEVLSYFRAFLEAYHPPIFNAKTGAAGIAHLLIRVGEGRHSNHGKEVMVGIVSTDPLLAFRDDMIGSLQQSDSVKSVFLVLNHHPEWAILEGGSILLWGENHLQTHLKNRDSVISLGSFFQANTKGTELLWDRVHDYLAPKSSETLLELYCGAGAMSLFLANSYNHLIGIENSSAAIQDANTAKSVHNQLNIEFIEGDVSSVLREASFEVSHILCDPPRTGLDLSVIDGILRLSPSKVVYVSCSPETLIRDLKLFSENGYCISKLSLLDLFPQTIHMESIVLLEKK